MADVEGKPVEDAVPVFLILRYYRLKFDSGSADLQMGHEEHRWCLSTDKVLSSVCSFSFVRCCCCCCAASFSYFPFRDRSPSRGTKLAGFSARLASSLTLRAA